MACSLPAVFVGLLHPPAVSSVVVLVVTVRQLALSLSRELTRTRQQTSWIANAIELNLRTTCMKLAWKCGELELVFFSISWRIKKKAVVVAVGSTAAAASYRKHGVFFVFCQRK